MHPSVRIRAITTLSATFEFFDFTLLIFLAPVIAATFFPAASGYGSIMPVLMVFFAGYVARFVGGVLFGHFGDVIGRKRFYMYAIVMMSLSTLGIALLPGHEQWGGFAPASLLLLRVLQGVSLGGEIPGSVVFASEYSANNRRGLVTGLVVFGVTFGNVLASAVVTGLYAYFGESAVYDWAWRIAFALGSLLGLFSFWLRRSLKETPVFTAMSETKRHSMPVMLLMREHRMALVRGFFLASVPAVTVSVLLFLPRFQQHYLQMPETTALPVTMVAFFLLASLSLVVAIVSDSVRQCRTCTTDEIRHFIDGVGGACVFLPAD